MSQPRVRSSGFARYAIVLMIVLGLVTILVNTTIAVVIVVLGVGMYLFERMLVGKAQRSLDQAK
jgi:hypothetical protein